MQLERITVSDENGNDPPFAVLHCPMDLSPYPFRFDRIRGQDNEKGVAGQKCLADAALKIICGANVHCRIPRLDAMTLKKGNQLLFDKPSVLRGMAEENQHDFVP